jgi:undecaprenyl diphosphate synthase
MRLLSVYLQSLDRLRLRKRSKIAIAGSKGQETGSGLKIPVHLAVIMDGNGRWAQKRSLPRQAGHRAGADKLRDVCRLCIQYGIRYLTVYAFSTENWSRPDSEVQTLMGLFIEYIAKFDKDMAQEGVRLRFTGDMSELSADMRGAAAQAEDNSRHRDRLQLIIALNYGGRREIVQACRKLAESVRTGEKKPEDIDEVAMHDALYLPDVPDPDLVIRPSGELRLSNFLLWESAYAELWFSDVLWPDFGESHLREALESYTSRDRRFGGVKAK